MLWVHLSQRIWKMISTSADWPWGCGSSRNLYLRHYFSIQYFQLTWTIWKKSTCQVERKARFFAIHFPKRHCHTSERMPVMTHMISHVKHIVQIFPNIYLGRMTQNIFIMCLINVVSTLLSMPQMGKELPKQLDAVLPLLGASHEPAPPLHATTIEVAPLLAMCSWQGMSSRKLPADFEHFHQAAAQRY